MNPANKLLYFEYILDKLLYWYVEGGSLEQANDLSILKSIKLLFFVSAVRANPGNDNNLIENVFNEFTAMPYGHVESDIYSILKRRNGDLNCFRFEENSLIRKIDFEPYSVTLEQIFLDEIDLSINQIKEINFNLINESPFNLVELSHAWFSWRKNYTLGKSKGSHSWKIPAIDIINEIKNFNLNLLNIA